MFYYSQEQSYLVSHERVFQKVDKLLASILLIAISAKQCFESCVKKCHGVGEIGGVTPVAYRRDTKFVRLEIRSLTSMVEQVYWREFEWCRRCYVVVQSPQVYDFVVDSGSDRVKMDLANCSRDV